MSESEKRSPILFRMLILSGAVLIFLIIYFLTPKQNASVPLEEVPSPVPSYPIRTDMKPHGTTHDRTPVYTFHAASYPDHPVNRIFACPVFSVFDETTGWKLSPPQLVPEKITLSWLVPPSVISDIKSAFLMLGIKKYKYARFCNADVYAFSLTSRKAILFLKEMRAQGLIPLTAGFPDIRSNFFYGTGDESVQLQMYFYFCK